MRTAGRKLRETGTSLRPLSSKVFVRGLTVEAVGGGIGLVDALWASAERAGITLRYNARAIALEQQDGRIRGVKVRARDGSTEVIPAGAVVLASGGFQSLAGASAVRALAAEHGFAAPTAAEAVQAALSSGSRGAGFLDELAHRVAVGVASVCAVLDPGLVVLGGDVGQAGLHLAVGDLRQRLARGVCGAERRQALLRIFAVLADVLFDQGIEETVTIRGEGALGDEDLS